MFGTSVASPGPGRVKTSKIPANLMGEADKYIAFKVEPLEARRASTAVVESTAQSDLNSYYRFLGFLKLKRLLPADVNHLSLGLLAHPSAADWVSAYLTFMKDERELAFSNMANYLPSLYSLATFVFENFDVPERPRTWQMRRTPCSTRPSTFAPNARYWPRRKGALAKEKGGSTPRNAAAGSRVSRHSRRASSASTR